MYGSSKFGTLMGVLGVGALVLGLALPSFAQPGPFEAVPPWLDTILDRLDDIETQLANQSTDLRGVTQNWDKKLDATNGDAATGCNSDRFTCLWGDTAVRDNETGIVWERSPDITGGSNGNGTRSWFSSIEHCGNREVGGRKGWSLPMREQLATLVDTSNNPALPTGHPFLNVQSARYWSASKNAEGPTSAWTVRFLDGDVGLVDTNGGLNLAWCARGGQVFDGNTHDTLH